MRMLVTNENYDFARHVLLQLLTKVLECSMFGCDSAVATIDGSILAISKPSETLLWTFWTDAQLTSTPVLSSGVLFFGSFNQQVYAVRMPRDCAQDVILAAVQESLRG